MVPGLRQIVICLLIAIFTHPAVSEAVIYGRDDRMERFAIAHTWLEEFARSSVALVDSKHIVNIAPGWITISGKSHIEDRNLCPDERFVYQPVISGCSGTLIAPRVVLTAGHCTAPDDENPSFDFCKDTYFIFDFASFSPGSVLVSHPLENVYRCRSVLRSVDRDHGLDFALIELDRDVIGRFPVPMRRYGQLGKDEELIAIGHPAGLPQKISAGAFLRTQGPIFFTANLDVSENSSGSPVFNLHRGFLEGIVASGEDDYEFDSDRQCNRAKRCPDDGCEGESVTKASAIFEAIQEIRSLKWQRLLEPQL